MIPATRKHSDEAYGFTGYWYFLWPALKCVFRTDYPGMKFNPEEDTQELTLLEFLEAALRYGYYLPHQDKDTYYYANAKGEVFKSKKPLPNCLELMASEYIELSLLLNVNPEDTLL